jgi:hypothetical protein
MKIQALILSACVFAFAAPAVAQNTPASDTVDVLADITPALLQFEIQDLMAMSFGTVRIPTTGNSVCRYIIGPDGSVAVREFTKAGDPVSNAAPTPAGCAQAGAISPAEFGLGCQAGETVQYQITYTSAGLPGLSFGSTAGGSPNVLRIAPSGAGAGQDLANAQGAFPCPASGQLNARIAGQLAIDDAAEPGAGVTVGQITLAVSY